MNQTIAICCLLLSSVAMLCTELAQAQNSTYLPEAYSLDRYTSLWENSPFSPESVIIESVNNAEWLMTGITVLDDAPMVTLTNRTTFKTVSLSPGESSDSVSLVSADWAGSYENSFAVVSINGSQKKISFDEQSLSMLSSRTAPKISQPVPANNNQRNVPQNAKTNTNTPSRNVVAPPNSNIKKLAPRRRIIPRPS